MCFLPRMAEVKKSKKKNGLCWLSNMSGKEINHITEKDFESILRYRLYGKSLTSGRTLMGKQTLKIKVP